MASLVILSLNHILHLATTEIEAIAEKHFPPLRDDIMWEPHMQWLMTSLEDHQSLVRLLCRDLKDFRGPDAVLKAILSASLEITYTFSPHDYYTLKQYEKVITFHADRKHTGIAYLLQMKRIQYQLHITKDDVRIMFQLRDKLCDDILEVTRRRYPGDVAAKISETIARTQLFIPRNLFQIPAVVQAVRKDGRVDCLRRPVGHMLFDNGIDFDHYVTTDPDEIDVLGRSSLHLACVAGHYEHFANLYDSFSGSIKLIKNVLYVAAVHGRTQVFRIAQEREFDVLLHSDSRLFRDAGRTHLHWAACYGHLDLVEYILNILETRDTSDMFMGKYLARLDWPHDTAIHLAARHGHMQVVQALLRGTDWSLMKGACSNHTPFWSAVSGGHVEIAQLLEPFSNVGENGAGGLTPLAEASRKGYHKIVQYLLSLQGVEVNSVIEVLDFDTGCFVWKTPLDYAQEGEHTKCMHILKIHGGLTGRELRLQEL